MHSPKIHFVNRIIIDFSRHGTVSSVRNNVCLETSLLIAYTLNLADICLSLIYKKLTIVFIYCQLFPKQVVT